MAGGRGFAVFIAGILTAGGLLFMFLIIFAGVIDNDPVNRWYFLQVDTSNIPGAPQISRWTYWAGCTPRSDGSEYCGPTHAAFPLDPPSSWNFDTTTNIPSGFLNTNGYFLMTRFMFAFMLIALFFGAVTLMFGIFALCSRVSSYFAGLFALVAALFQACNCALMTSAYVIGRNLFRDNGQSAQIGTYAFGFEWAGFACYLLAAIFYCCTGGRKKVDRTNSDGTGMFKGRSKSTRSTGSFRTKEYA